MYEVIDGKVRLTLEMDIDEYESRMVEPMKKIEQICKKHKCVYGEKDGPGKECKNLKKLIKNTIKPPGQSF